MIKSREAGLECPNIRAGWHAHSDRNTPDMCALAWLWLRTASRRGSRPTRCRHTSSRLVVGCTVGRAGERTHGGDYLVCLHAIQQQHIIPASVLRMHHVGDWQPSSLLIKPYQPSPGARPGPARLRTVRSTAQCMSVQPCLSRPRALEPGWASRKSSSSRSASSTACREQSKEWRAMAGTDGNPASPGRPLHTLHGKSNSVWNNLRKGTAMVGPEGNQAAPNSTATHKHPTCPASSPCASVASRPARHAG